MTTNPINEICSLLFPPTAAGPTGSYTNCVNQLDHLGNELANKLKTEIASGHLESDIMEIPKTVERIEIVIYITMAMVAIILALMAMLFFKKK